MVRAKLRLAHIRQVTYSPDMPKQTTLRFEALYDNNTPEDQRFQKATPSGWAELQIDNPAALEQFVAGESYYVDFTPAK